MSCWLNKAMPFSDKESPKLPTHRQFIKANPPAEPITRWSIERVFWSSEWKSVTFVTSEFRYTIKADDKEGYSELTNSLMDAYTPDGFVYAEIFYNSEAREWVVFWEVPFDYPEEEPSKVDKFDWGFVVKPAGDERPKQPKALASKKKPAST